MIGFSKIWLFILIVTKSLKRKGSFSMYERGKLPNYIGESFKNFGD